MKKLILTYVETNNKVWTPSLGHLGSSFAIGRAGVRAGQVGKYQVKSLEDRGNFVIVFFQGGQTAYLPWASIKVADGEEIDDKPAQAPNTSKPVNGPTNS